MIDLIGILMYIMQWCLAHSKGLEYLFPWDAQDQMTATDQPQQNFRYDAGTYCTLNHDYSTSSICYAAMWLFVSQMASSWVTNDITINVGQDIVCSLDFFLTGLTRLEIAGKRRSINVGAYSREDFSRCER